MEWERGDFDGSAEKGNGERRVNIKAEESWKAKKIPGIAGWNRGAGEPVLGKI